MKKPTAITMLELPSLKYEGSPPCSPKQVAALQAEFFLIKALDRALWSFRDEYLEVVRVMNYIQKDLAAEGIATEQGKANLVDYVFNDTFVRDFIYSVNLNFMSMFSEWHSVWKDLINNIALGLTMAPVGSDVLNNNIQSDIPAEIRQRQISLPDMAAWLNKNNWAVILIMLKMWGSVPDAK